MSGNGKMIKYKEKEFILAYKVWNMMGNGLKINEMAMVY